MVLYLPVLKNLGTGLPQISNLCNLLIFHKWIHLALQRYPFHALFCQLIHGKGWYLKFLLHWKILFDLIFFALGCVLNFAMIWWTLSFHSSIHLSGSASKFFWALWWKWLTGKNKAYRGKYNFLNLHKRLFKYFPYTNSGDLGLLQV